MARRGYRIGVQVQEMDGLLARFGNQIAALGEGKARVALARAVNRAGRTTATHVRRALVKQTGLKRSLVNAEVKSTGAAHKGAGPIEFVIYARGSEVPLREFGARQFKFGVRAKPWGTSQRFAGAFIFAGSWKSGKSIAGGHVFHRTGGMSDKSGRRNAIEKMFGPSIPKEMVKGETERVFQEVSRREVEQRLRHELGRMLGD